MNPMTSRKEQIEKHFLKHTPSNPTKHVELKGERFLTLPKVTQL